MPTLLVRWDYWAGKPNVGLNQSRTWSTTAVSVHNQYIKRKKWHQHGVKTGGSQPYTWLPTNESGVGRGPLTTRTPQDRRYWSGELNYLSSHGWLGSRGVSVMHYRRCYVTIITTFNTANLLENLAVKEFWKSVKICQIATITGIGPKFGV